MSCPSQSSRFNHPDYIRWTYSPLLVLRILIKYNCYTLPFVIKSSWMFFAFWSYWFHNESLQITSRVSPSKGEPHFCFTHCVVFHTSPWTHVLMYLLPHIVSRINLCSAVSLIHLSWRQVTTLLKTLKGTSLQAIFKWIEGSNKQFH